jgi:hypothetical protein
LASGRSKSIVTLPAAGDKVAGCWGRCNAGESISKRLLQIGVAEVKIRDKAVGRICTHVEGLK